MSRTNRLLARTATVFVIITVHVAVASFFRPAKPPSRPVRGAATAIEPSPDMGDSSQLHHDAAPQVDPAALAAVLDQAGVTPQTIQQARAGAREEALRILHSDADPFQKRVAIFHLWNSKQVDDEVVDVILALLAMDPPDEALVAQGLYAMKDSPRQDVGAATMAWLRSSSSAVVRMSAVKALHFRPGQDVTRALDEALGAETDPQVQRRLVVAIASRAVADPAARGTLETTMRYAADPSLRQLAEEMIAENDRVLEACAAK